MRSRGIAAASLMTLGIFASYSVLADGQTKIDDPKKAAKDIFWDELYSNGGKSFFCKQPFEGKTRRIVAGHIYNTHWMIDTYDCGTKSRCRKSNTDYKYAASDLHNIYPISPRVELNRRNSKYAELPPR